MWILVRTENTPNAALAHLWGGRVRLRSLLVSTTQALLAVVINFFKILS
jgi:hypothetical protein